MDDGGGSIVAHRVCVCVYVGMTACVVSVCVVCVWVGCVGVWVWEGGGVTGGGAGGLQTNKHTYKHTHTARKNVQAHASSRAVEQMPPGDGR